MNTGEKTDALVKLGEYIDELILNDQNQVYKAACQQNPWFIPPFVNTALSGISHFLKKKTLAKWLEAYDLNTQKPKTIGLILAGNIPLVGFHDLLCVLFSGHCAHIKISHQDRVLIKHLLEKLYTIEPGFKTQIRLVTSIDKTDAVIATGSDNTARYFRAYFRHIPHLIRKNRTSIAILDGSETAEDLNGLSNDMFLYFGLGCRNVSKIYLPEKYKFDFLFSILENKKWLGDHPKFRSNYIYQKSCSRVLDMDILDGNFFLFLESDQLVSPVSAVYYSYYRDLDNVMDTLILHKDKIQSLVTKVPNIKNAVSFGRAQIPDPWDYADQIDTLAFLLQLNELPASPDLDPT